MWLDPPLRLETSTSRRAKGDSGGARGASSLTKQKSIFTCRHSQLGWSSSHLLAWVLSPPADELVSGLPTLIALDVSRIQSLFTGRQTVLLTAWARTRLPRLGGQAGSLLQAVIQSCNCTCPSILLGNYTSMQGKFCRIIAASLFTSLNFSLSRYCCVSVVVEPSKDLHRLGNLRRHRGAFCYGGRCRTDLSKCHDR